MRYKATNPPDCDLTMKTQPCHWTLRAVSLLLVACLNLTTLPGFAWAAALDAVAPQQPGSAALPGEAPAAVRINRRAPSPGPVSWVPRFSAQPTEAELSSVPVFSDALAPVGKTTPQENKDLALALTHYAQRTDPADQSSLLDFLQRYPDSAWKPALLLNLGDDWRHQGHFSRAIAAWQEGWQLSRSKSETAAKAMADRLLGELCRLSDWAGNYESLQPLLKQAEGRALSGAAEHMVESARHGLLAVNNQTADFKCGPHALQQLVALNSTNGGVRKLFESMLSPKGSSLAQLKQLALQSGMRYQMARRQPGGAVPTNSVVHWRLNHYSAIIGEQSGVYRALDPAYSLFYGQQLRITQGILDEESDGYFLIPEGPLPAGWVAVSPEEGRTIWGRGNTKGPAPGAYTPQDAKMPGGCPKPGMAAYSAHLMMVNLNIQDIPIRYQPPRGPAVAFLLTYNHKDDRPEANPTYSNLGPKWTFDWLSYIEDSSSGNPQSSVARFVSGGGWVTHSGYNSATGSYAPGTDGAILTYVPSNSGSTPPTLEHYELTFPDGSKQAFAQPDAGTSARKMFLTAIRDRAGNALSFSYDNQLRIAYITDALNQATTFHYDLPNGSGIHVADSWKITSIEDPFGRSAQVEYDSSGRLFRITDLAGMTSTFTYDTSDVTFINKMTTPYSDTTFSYQFASDNSTGSSPDNLMRKLTITDPTSAQECILYEDTSSLPTSDAVSPTVTDWPTVGTTTTMPNLYNEFRNTFYFSKIAMDKVLHDVDTDPAHHLDWAVVYHWLHDLSTVTPRPFCSGLLEALKPPLEGRIHFWYAGQSLTALDGTCSDGITLRSPYLVARLVEDPAKPDSTAAGDQLSQIYRFEHNAQGKLTKITDPLMRQTTYDYAANGIDLLKVHQTTPQIGYKAAIDQTLGEFAGYTAHVPATHTDAARQIYAFQWNAFGQLAQVTNPNNETTQYRYDADGFLLGIDELWQGGLKTTSFGYDGYGRPSAVTNSEQYYLLFQYDPLDRLTRVTYPDQSSEKCEYSRLDLVRTWDRSNHRTQATYDGAGRLLTSTDRLNRLTQFTWCNCGGLNSITDPLGHMTSWIYDLEGRVTTSTYSAGPSHFFDYYSYSGRLKDGDYSGRF
jgi:YD repeat-containing protein